MQEIQDMLNRMVTLATQSANGTYDEETDRDNLQKEVDALKDEINRIADSANFNGIKLLDGSMAAGQDNANAGNMTVGDLLPKVGSVVGTDTVLHVEEASATAGTSFDIDLGNLNWTAATNGTLTVKIGSASFTVTATSAGEVTATQVAAKLASAITTKGSITIGSNKFTVATTASATKATTITVSASGGKVTITQAKAPTKASQVLTAPTTVTVTKASTTGDWGVTTAKGQDYNAAVTNINNVTLEGAGRLASTSFKLTADMAGDGATLTLADTTYTFTSDKANKGQTGYVYVGDLDLTKAEDLQQAGARLTKAAASNTYFSVGFDGTNVTLTENDTVIDYTQKDLKYDFSTEEGLSAAISYHGVPNSGKGLQLQIGDTSDDYNQLNVSISDMHVKALGIENIDISTQSGAQDAIDYIKDAINKVSSTRGDLGAVQNRLEHTSNNLSVMSENIQDAESTIRDTDIAEEMMSYTKNNILVQSAQAMLAQANSVPQGVLQLLQ
jgi:flagellin